MLLYSVRFLCAVVAAFAQLVRGLRKAMGATLLHCSPWCSPVPVSPGAGLATTTTAPPLTSLRWMAPRRHDDGDDDDDKRVLMEPLVTSVAAAAPAPAAPLVVVAACNGSVSVDVEVEQVETRTKKAAAWAARRRPSMLVIPVAPDAGEMTAAGWGVAVAEKEEAEVELAGDGFWLASRRGARHAMEDGYGVITHKTGADSQLAFFGVYDGHGGRAAVDFVSDRLGKNVVAAVLAAAATQEDGNASPANDAVTAAIRAAYLATDSEFLGQGVRGGSCAATALVKDGDLYVANLGDCRAVMSRDGAAIAVTSDHTAAREDERARIESSGGYVSCGSNGVWRVQDCLAVSRAFGDGSLKRWVISEPEITRVPVVAGCEFLVLASDGLWNKVSNQEAVDAVSRSTVVGCCKELVDMARSRGSRDDITVMVVDLKRFACAIG